MPASEALLNITEMETVERIYSIQNLPAANEPTYVKVYPKQMAQYLKSIEFVCHINIILYFLKMLHIQIVHLIYNKTFFVIFFFLQFHLI